MAYPVGVSDLRPLRTTGLLLSLLALVAPAEASAQQRCLERTRHALVIGIDGARGDVLHALALERETLPAIRALMEHGSHAPCPDAHDPGCARAHPGPAAPGAAIWVTAPGWASVLSGVVPARHGVASNAHESLAKYATREHPSFLLRARRAGLRTAAGGVGAFLTSTDGDGIYPGVLDYECGTRESGPAVEAGAGQSCNLDARLGLDSRDPDRDDRLTRWMVGHIEHSTHVIMGVLDRVDETGHRRGFGPGAHYAAALARADAQVGRLLAAVRRAAAQRCEAWLVVLTSDHGGHARQLGGGAHGGRAGPDDAIPFVLASFGGPRVGALTWPVFQVDVHPTLLRWLGLRPADDLDGWVQGLR